MRTRPVPPALGAPAAYAIADWEEEPEEEDNVVFVHISSSGRKLPAARLIPAIHGDKITKCVNQLNWRCLADAPFILGYSVEDDTLAQLIRDTF